MQTKITVLSKDLQTPQMGHLNPLFFCPTTHYSHQLVPSAFFIQFLFDLDPHTFCSGVTGWLSNQKFKSYVYVTLPNPTSYSLYMDILLQDTSPLRQHVSVVMRGDSQHAIDCDTLHIQLGVAHLAQHPSSDPYVQTLCMLVLTPNDTTLYNHMHVPNLERHWWVLGSLLTCNNQKVNKSSVLWTHYVRVTTQMWTLAHRNSPTANSSIEPASCTVHLTAPSTMADLHDLSMSFVVDRTADVLAGAIRAHPRNYYAANNIPPLVQLMGDPLLAGIQSALFKIDDLSLWLAWVRAHDDQTLALDWIRGQLAQEGLLSCMASGKQVLSVYESVQRQKR